MIMITLWPSSSIDNQQAVFSGKINSEHNTKINFKSINRSIEDDYKRKDWSIIKGAKVICCQDDEDEEEWEKH